MKITASPYSHKLDTKANTMAQFISDVLWYFSDWQDKTITITERDSTCVVTITVPTIKNQDGSTKVWGFTDTFTLTED